ncbi:hypothetical protein [Ruania albidiflava]|uniref:hypothetical protein n=1 Tax=Ruania albidiflava TaxID=366586 RepID=UPI0023F2A6F7|nr:hypothetical protein [Ruania albidiflava]
MHEAEPPPLQRAGGGAGAVVMLACLVLLVASAVGALLLGPLSKSPVPQPGLPEAPAYLATHVAAVFGVAASDLVAAAALYIYGAYVPHVVHSLRRIRFALLVAVAALTLAALAGFALAVVAPVASDSVIHVLHTASWLCGGVLHIGTLGLYVAWLARSLFWSPTLRVYGVLAGWFAVAAMAVLAFGELSPLATVARVACLFWLLLAAHQSAFRDPS